MELPQIDAAACAVLVTLSLWVWLRLKLPKGCQHKEAGLRRQNVFAYWSFSGLVLLEVLSQIVSASWLAWFIGPASGCIVYAFAVASYQSDGGFWSKKRNQMLGFLVIVTSTSLSCLFFVELSFVPMFASLLISHMCHKKYVQTVFASIQDLETLQAKLLREEADRANMRHFDQSHIRQSSQQA